LFASVAKEALKGFKEKAMLLWNPYAKVVSGILVRLPRCFLQSI
jgi:hypothetical protein